MKVKVKIKREIEVTTLLVDAGVHYWEDGTVNEIQDIDGVLIPCRDGDRWKPIIDIESGVITNWTKGVKAEVHYKICDDGVYHLANSNGEIMLTKDGYVPDILDFHGESYGDYIILNIDENGKIEDWDNQPQVKDFKNKFKG